jgi:hypothetical protein
MKEVMSEAMKRSLVGELEGVNREPAMPRRLPGAAGVTVPAARAGHRQDLQQ